jgi:hypothetical protein
MSIYQKASLVQIPSGYKAADDKLYSVVPSNGDGDFTVTVDADATRVNKDGLIESVVADQARLNYDPTNPQDPHLLLEPTRVNFITRSEEFDNSYWTKEGVSIGTGILSPMGDANARNMVEQTSTGRHRVRATLSVSSGTTYSLSVWVKSSNRNLVINGQALFNARSGFNLSNGSVENTTSGTATITEYPNDWYRCTVIGTATSTQATVMYFQMQEGTTDVSYTGDGSSTLSLFGAQMEAGSYPTSYIPTSGIAETRTADSCEKTSVASGIINQTEGVIFLDFENYGQIGTSYGNHFKIESAGNNDRVAIQSDAAALNRLIFVINDGNSTFFQPREDISLGRNKIAIKYKSGDIDVFLNGTKIESSTSSFTFTNTLNKIYIGQPNKLYQAMVFNEALSDSELQTLTS